MIVFYGAVPPWVNKKKARLAMRPASLRDSSRKRIQKLEQELVSAKEQLQSVMENQEVTNEELQSANEEILSSNEELQSTNEELETAKEELQSTNEELSTVNDELRSRNLQMSESQKELRDLLTGVDVAFIGADSQIRELAPNSQKLLHLLPPDISAQIMDPNLRVNNPEFQQLVKQALANMADDGQYVTDRKGKSYRVLVRPCLLPNGTVDGHILTLTDASLATRLLNKHLFSAEDADDGNQQDEKRHEENMYDENSSMKSSLTKSSATKSGGSIKPNRASRRR
jgi:two-component system CheB/CheR fusion protein